MLLLFGSLYAQTDAASAAMADTLQSTVEEYQPSLADSTGLKLQKSEVLDEIRILQALDNRGLALGHTVQSLPLQYRFEYSSMMLHNDPLRLRVYGFELPSSLMDTGVYLDYLSRYHTLSGSAIELNAGHYSYSLPLTISGIKGVLGDYDSRQVTAFLAREGLFGINNAGIHLDFSVQNGYWLDQPGSGTSLRPRISYHLNNIDMAVEYASYQKDGSSLELVPNLWTQAAYRVEHNYNHLYAHIAHPMVKVSLLSSRDRIKSATFTKNLENKTLQMAIESGLQLAGQELGWRYEYRDEQRNYSLVDTYNSISYTQKLEMMLKATLYLQGRAHLELLDWENLRSNIQLEKSLGTFSLGLFDHRYFGDHDQDYMGINPFDDSPMSALGIHNDAESGFLAQWQSNSLKLYASLAAQKIGQYSQSSELEKQQGLLRLGAEYTPRFGDWELELAPAWKVQDYSYQLMENPQYVFTSNQSITRHLGYGNALSAGLKILGHSEYYLANTVNPVLVEASTALDAWLGVKIGPLFDFRVSAQNLLNTSIFGVYPIPFSMHARIRWYFIN